MQILNFIKLEDVETENAEEKMQLRPERELQGFRQTCANFKSS